MLSVFPWFLSVSSGLPLLFVSRFCSDSRVNESFESRLDPLSKLMESGYMLQWLSKQKGISRRERKASLSYKWVRTVPRVRGLLSGSLKAVTLCFDSICCLVIICQLVPVRFATLSLRTIFNRDRHPAPSLASHGCTCRSNRCHDA